ncbi:general stress protein [Oceanobacillus sp. FSL K6-2867]|uniref:general stress protein n=1 Tax=Oceanobacillus sp. FSL K6-2867 TaxID=2954748 RepID=UPI0030DC544A
MNNHIVGIYDTEEQAVKAVEQLKSKGYTIDKISIIAQNTNMLKESAEEISPSTTDGAVAGAAAGGAIGVTGLFIGLSALAIPGIGPVIAAGPIITTLGGAAAGAASGAGGLKHALLEIGVSNEEAERYSNDVKEGKILVFLHPKE